MRSSLLRSSWSSFFATAAFIELFLPSPRLGTVVALEPAQKYPEAIAPKRNLPYGRGRRSGPVDRGATGRPLLDPPHPRSRLPGTHIGGMDASDPLAYC